jgi:hypothetical protein
MKNKTSGLRYANFRQSVSGKSKSPLPVTAFENK